MKREQKSQLQGEILGEDESEWVTLSGEFICAAVAFGDRKFAKQDSENQKLKKAVK